MIASHNFLKTGKMDIEQQISRLLTCSFYKQVTHKKFSLHQENNSFKHTLKQFVIGATIRGTIIFTQ